MRYRTLYIAHDRRARSFCEVFYKYKYIFFKQIQVFTGVKTQFLNDIVNVYEIEVGKQMKRHYFKSFYIQLFMIGQKRFVRYILVLQRSPCM